MRRYCPLSRSKSYRQRLIELRHDDVPIFIREREQDPMFTLLDLLEPQPPGDRALRMRHRRLERPQGIERPDDVQLPRILRRRVAKREDFQLHLAQVSLVR